MKKVKFVLAVAAISLQSINANAQVGKLKDKMASASSGVKTKGGGSFESFNTESDELGVTGQYFGLVDSKSFGFRFVKEENGKIVNSLHYFEKKGTNPQLKLTLKEKYHTKNNVKMFYAWINPSASAYVELLELAPGVFAQIAGDRSQNDDNPIALDAKRTVKDVFAKDKNAFDTWDIETAQAQTDMIIASLNVEAMEKETAKWMENEVYAKNVGKIVFADQDYHLMKRGYMNKPPMVNGKDFKTVLDMNNNMQYMAFFKFPPKDQFPGQEINVIYEMGGKTANRTELRAKSSAWNKMIKRLETKDFEYRQHSPRALREFNSYQGQYVQDYAFINVLYQNKDQFMIDQTYDLTVKMYINKDGVNGDLLAEGVVKLKYTKEAQDTFTKQGGVWSQFGDFLDE